MNVPLEPYCLIYIAPSDLEAPLYKWATQRNERRHDGYYRTLFESREGSR